MIFVAPEHYFLIACSLLHKWQEKSHQSGSRTLNKDARFPVRYGALANKSRSISRIKIWKCGCY